MSVAPEPYKLALSHWPVMVACSDSLAVVVVMESGAVMNLQAGRTTDWVLRGKKSPMGEKREWTSRIGLERGVGMIRVLRQGRDGGHLGEMLIMDAQVSQRSMIIMILLDHGRLNDLFFLLSGGICSSRRRGDRIYRACSSGHGVTAER